MPNQDVQTEINTSTRRIAKRLKEFIGDSKDIASASGLVIAAASGLGVSAGVAVPMALLAVIFLKKGLEAMVKADNIEEADDEGLEEKSITEQSKDDEN